jgi:hypothetical protein
VLTSSADTSDLWWQLLPGRELCGRRKLHLRQDPEAATRQQVRDLSDVRAGAADDVWRQLQHD